MTDASSPRARPRACALRPWNERSRSNAHSRPVGLPVSWGGPTRIFIVPLTEDRTLDTSKLEARSHNPTRLHQQHPNPDRISPSARNSTLSNHTALGHTDHSRQRGLLVKTSSSRAGARHVKKNGEVTNVAPSNSTAFLLKMPLQIKGSVIVFSRDTRAGTRSRWLAVGRIDV